ncbi:outer membrane beta-barrel protein [uncultured Nitratireductor sp.]|uniref:outer membrane protein n=1 Tax=uncultured Nitratireductor sp. TaxID=520953 RepID=UPI0026205D99|nr:outer membrane beta-barrel protein [uncultured Nitratireductor sp.]
MRSVSRLLVSTAIIAVASVVGSNAADYDPPIVFDDTPDIVPVEIGSGWYLRGDIAYNFERTYKNRSIAFGDPFATPAPFIAPVLWSLEEKEGVFSGSVGMGYSFSDMFRGDVELGFLSKDTTNITGTGSCGGTEVVELDTTNAAGEPVTIRTESAGSRPCAGNIGVENSSWNAMVNGYVDLGTINGFTPYIGAGVGVAYTPYELNVTGVCSGSRNIVSNGADTLTTSFLCHGQSSPDGADVEYVKLKLKNRPFSLAYSLSAGFAYQMTQNTKLDVGYRYLSAPKAEYISISPDGYGIGEGLDYHQLRVGLRYELW